MKKFNKSHYIDSLDLIQGPVKWLFHYKEFGYLTGP